MELPLDAFTPAPQAYRLKRPVRLASGRWLPIGTKVRIDEGPRLCWLIEIATEAEVAFTAAQWAKERDGLLEAI